jgi:hypothetical protein
MVSRKKTVYVPVLRMKMGELEGLRLLQTDVADCIAPMLVVPPAKERKLDGQEALFPAGQDAPDVGGDDRSQPGQPQEWEISDGHGGRAQGIQARHDAVAPHPHAAAPDFVPCAAMRRSITVVEHWAPPELSTVIVMRSRCEAAMTRARSASTLCGSGGGVW